MCPRLQLLSLPVFSTSLAFGSPQMGSSQGPAGPRLDGREEDILSPKTLS